MKRASRNESRLSMHARVARGAVTAVASLLAPAFAPAQQVWTVTNQTELLAPIGAAAPGDVVRLVETGSSMFAPFTLAKGLTLRGPATIGSVSAPLVLVGVPSGQVAQFVDLTFQTFTAQYRSPSVSTVEVHGTARFDGLPARLPALGECRSRDRALSDR